LSCFGSCKVISFSSEDEDYPATQLNTISPNTRGWQSCRFPSYPQELGFQILDGEAPIAQLQLLSHQSKIATKIEMFIGRGATYKTANFVRLGYMSLDSNERSSFQARELKTIYIDNIPGSYIRLIISENHVNKLNIYNQVGIIAVSILGPTEDSLAAPKVSKYQPGAKHGPATNYNDLSIDLNLDPQTAGKLRQLAEAKTRAVDAEDYLTAKQIKVVEQELKAMGSKLAQMDMAKADAVAAEDYDLAKEIKDETDHLRREIEQKVGFVPFACNTDTSSPACYFWCFCADHRS
jgi:centrosomal protein CEP104